jgi:hypothetical protein
MKSILHLFCLDSFKTFTWMGRASHMFYPWILEAFALIGNTPHKKNICSLLE